MTPFWAQLCLHREPMGSSGYPPKEGILTHENKVGARQSQDQHSSGWTQPGMASLASLASFHAASPELQPAPSPASQVRPMLGFPCSLAGPARMCPLSWAPITTRRPRVNWRSSAWCPARKARGSNLCSKLHLCQAEGGASRQLQVLEGRQQGRPACLY